MRQSVVSRRQEVGENWKRLLICSLLTISLSSCKHLSQKDIASTYCNPSQKENSLPIANCQLPSTSCSVSMFTNESQQYGFEEMFSNLLIKEIVHDGRIDVVNSQSSDLRIKGKILSYERSPISYGEGYINKYRLSMRIEIIILNRSNEVIKKKTLDDFIDFIPLSSPLTTKGFAAREENEVIQELCQRICRQVIGIMVKIVA